MKSYLPFSRALAFGGLAAFLGGCVSPTTYGTGVSPGAQTIEDIAGLVSLSGKKRPTIDYTPRPPIVAPPATAALPPPGTGGGAAADWPVDPDKRTTVASAGRKVPGDGGTYAYDDPGFRVPTNQPASRPDADYDSAKAAYEAHVNAGKKATQIFATVKSNGNMSVDANGNPVRKVLSEPPTTYRVPDPESPDAFTDTSKKTKKKWWWPF